MKGNCMTGCVHYKIKDIIKKTETKDSEGNVIMISNEFMGYEHFCDKCPKAFSEWKQRNADKTYEEYKKDVLPCYTPTDVAASLNKMIELEKEILENI